MNRKHLIIIFVIIIAAFIIGCGGHHGGTGNTTATTSGATAGVTAGTTSGNPTAVSVSLTVDWPARSRNTSAPSSALSGMVTLKGASASGADVTFPLDRGTNTNGFTQTYSSPTTVIPGSWPTSINFYAGASQALPIVANGMQQSIVTSSGGSLGTIGVTNTVTSVTVAPNQVVGVDGTVSLVATAKDQSGQMVAVSPGSFTWSAGTQSALSVTPTGTATGLMVGQTNVTATVDNVSNAAPVYVSATGSPLPALHPVGSQVQSWYDQFDPTDYEKVVKVAASLGLTSMRFDVHWDDIFIHSGGVIDPNAIARYQSFVGVDKKYGMSTILIGDTSTSYLPTTEQIGFPTNSSDRTAYCSTFASFLKQLPGGAAVDGKTIQISASDYMLEVGNESNENCTSTDQVNQYVLLATALKQAMIADGVAVRMAGPACSTFQDQNTGHISSTIFATACEQVPFDVWTFHAYCGTAAPSTLSGTVSQLVGIFHKGNASAPIVTTETGYSTSTDGNGVPAATQSTYDIAMVQMLETAGIANIIVYKARDLDNPAEGEPEASFGITTGPINDLTLKPAATALQNYLVPANQAIRRISKAVK